MNENKQEMHKAKCIYYEQCGGCQLQHIPYELQLTRKKNKIMEFLKQEKINVPVFDVLGMENPYFYRNKNQLVLGTSKRGHVMAGFYQERSHKITPIDVCVIQNETANRIMDSVKRILSKLHIPAYDEDTKEGLVRHLLIKTGYKTNEVMVVIITCSEVFPGRNNFVRALREAHPEITTIIQNINSRSTSIILGDRERVLFGKGTIEDELCGLRFRISAKSFYQVNPIQTEVLYNKAIEYAELSKEDRVIDTYCGIGTIGLLVSNLVKEVIGVEFNKDAVQDAILNAKLNNRKNIRFYQADASEFMTSLAENQEKIDVVFIDPPRKGCDEAFIQALIKLKPKKIIYVSCDPETLARDLQELSKEYFIKQVQPVDMFPQTSHIESVTLLVRK